PPLDVRFGRESNIRVRPACQLADLVNLTYSERSMRDIRKKSGGLGVVKVPSEKLWGGQTQRSLELTVRRAVEK
ncbi:MAG TPA: hypothetical protein VNO32_04970, partial [Candidatus Acidoferrum sp.]|nr:hypothetical protein [Candidatus Acidoferrum sp.]